MWFAVAVCYLILVGVAVIVCCNVLCVVCFVLVECCSLLFVVVCVLAAVRCGLCVVVCCLLVLLIVRNSSLFDVCWSLLFVWLLLIGVQ